MLAVGYGHKRTLLTFDLSAKTWSEFDPQPPWSDQSVPYSGGSQGIATTPQGHIIVGDEASPGRMRHYDPDTGLWTAHVVPGYSNPRCLTADAFSIEHVYVGISGAGKIFRFDGTEYLEVLDGNNPVYDIHVVNQNKVWIVQGTGTSSQIWEYDGDSWTNHKAQYLTDGGQNTTISSVRWFADDYVLVGNNSDYIWRWNGSNWSEHGDLNGNVMAIWGVDTSTIYALCYATDRIWRYTGSWDNLYTLYGLDPSKGQPEHLRGLDDNVVFSCNRDTSACGGIYSTDDGWVTSTLYQYALPADSTYGIYALAAYGTPPDFSDSIADGCQYGIQPYGGGDYGEVIGCGYGDTHSPDPLTDLLCGDITDHQTAALALLPGQFEDSTKLRELIKAFIGPPGVGSWGVQQLECVLAALRDNRWIATAEGEQLDLLAEIVGAVLPSSDPDACRCAVALQIRINASEGTPEELLSIAKDLAGADAVHLQDRPPSRVVLYLHGIPQNQSLLWKLGGAAGAGIAVTVTGTTVKHPFRFGVDRDAAGDPHGAVLPYGAGFGETTFGGIGGNLTEVYEAGS
jgi:hypothetical protein